MNRNPETLSTGLQLPEEKCANYLEIVIEGYGQSSDDMIQLHCILNIRINKVKT